MECKLESMNASTFAVNLSMSRFLFADILSRKMR
ncbi:hypothetical protein SAMN05216386_1006 [Nitrosospira briensis]|uniref:Uncharacterized protein n=1 Tax=Nitrosospira briensis TaxID=35799 RepID=A0A1I4Z380_9PROT|nr:hypothetical protein SAMN05216386_1006 [Nitrosospira briensis]